MHLSTQNNDYNLKQSITTIQAKEDKNVQNQDSVENIHDTHETTSEENQSDFVKFSLSGNNFFFEIF